MKHLRGYSGKKTRHYHRQPCGKIDGWWIPLTDLANYPIEEIRLAIRQEKRRALQK